MTDHKIKILILGIPIDASRESPENLKRFKEALELANQENLPIFAAANANYFKLFAPDGWDMIQRMGLKVQIIKIDNLKRRRSLVSLAEKIIAEAKTSKHPLIFLRPGNPEIGDVPVEKIKSEYSSRSNEIRIFCSRSGPDIVGDYAEEKLKLSEVSREHFSGKQFLKREGCQSLDGKLLLIRSLSEVYDDDRIGLFKLVLNRLKEMKVKRIYIKSPQNDGRVRKVDEILDELDSFDLKNHYTIAAYVT